MERSSNPRYFSNTTFSKLSPSTTLPSILKRKLYLNENKHAKIGNKGFCNFYFRYFLIESEMLNDTLEMPMLMTPFGEIHPEARFGIF